MPSEWVCRFCDRPQVVTNENSHRSDETVRVGNSKYDDVMFKWTAIRCLNPHCNEISISAYLSKRTMAGSNFVSGRTIFNWTLRPESRARPQPEYIPEPLRVDYSEACLIRDKSPKASATLARRCIQGMIRDFCGISERTLDQEIKNLRALFDADKAPKGVSDESIVAIDKVRSVGNIGAHMERDINVIVDVDPDEAQILIDLVELLFEEWYVAREKRRVRLEELSRLADEKQEDRKLAPPAPKLLT